MELKTLKSADYDAVIAAATEGMNLGDYVEQGWKLRNYARCFFYDELLKASHVLAAYEGEQLAGVLLLNLHDYPKAMRSWWRSLYVKGFQFLERTLHIGHQCLPHYKELLSDYLRTSPVDGEISYVVAIPGTGIKGVGRFLLAEANKIAEDKHLFLVTDDGCNYGFYDAMGFQRAGNKHITYEGPRGTAQRECMLYVTPSSSAIC